MKRVVFAICALCVMLCSCESGFERELNGVLEDAKARYGAYAVEVEQNNKCFPYAFSSGEMLPAEGDKMWACGYFPGSLWLLAEWSEDEALRETAHVLTRKIDRMPASKNIHDMAMILNVAHYNGYRQIGGQRLWESMDMVARVSSNSFSALYCTIPREESEPDWYQKVGIWNLPTLEFLYELGWKGNVMVHAQKTIEYQMNENGAANEAMVFNRFTFEGEKPFSLHGESAESAWSRGQAWALYGFAMLHRKSEDKLFLEQAEKCAEYILSHLPEDGVPNWDFDSTDELKDSSAAAIMASAFIDLYNQTGKQEYLLTAERQLKTLCSAEYLAAADECGGLLLKHGVGNRMTGDAVDAALAMGDYYLIEAITRYLNR